MHSHPHIALAHDPGPGVDTHVRDANLALEQGICNRAALARCACPVRGTSFPVPQHTALCVRTTLAEMAQIAALAARSLAVAAGARTFAERDELSRIGLTYAAQVRALAARLP